MIVLDTAAWIWAVSDPAKVSDPAREIIASATPRYLSPISAWEVGMLVARGRIRLDRPVDRWVADAAADVDAVWAELSPEVAVLSTQLPGEPPADPADRIIVATALRLGCALTTPDRALHAYPFVPTVW